MFYFEKVKENGVFIIVIDLREIVIIKIVDLYLKFKLGSDVVLVNGILKIFIEENYLDEWFL